MAAGDGVPHHCVDHGSLIVAIARIEQKLENVCNCVENTEYKINLIAEKFTCHIIESTERIDQIKRNKENLAKIDLIMKDHHANTGFRHGATKALWIIYAAVISLTLAWVKMFFANQ